MYVNINLSINSKLEFDVCKKSIGLIKKIYILNFSKSKFMKNMEK